MTDLLKNRRSCHEHTRIKKFKFPSMSKNFKKSRPQNFQACRLLLPLYFFTAILPQY